MALEVNKRSSIPKYIQIAECISNDIAEGRINLGDRIPSINDLSETNKVSRDTIEKAYKILRKRSLIFSVLGVGNFVSANCTSTVKVLFLINKPSSYKMEIYNAFANSIGTRAQINMFLYNCDEQLFIDVLQKNSASHNFVVIMPHFKGLGNTHVNYTPEVIRSIEKIDKDKLIILDNSHVEIAGILSAVYQDYKKDTFNALFDGLEKFKKYKRINFVYPTNSVFPYPARVQDAFIEFCMLNGIEYQLLEKIEEDLEFDQKEVYITIEDGDLVRLMQQIKKRSKLLGKDVGVISYNDTPLKALLGITVMSTDFKAMGEMAAELILTNKKRILKNPFRYIERNSL
ncbi:GntR family transcriptional regulator [Flavobacterium frigidimaris]|nr:GntR family transcriptional regulator [Flavobacterium frigidimaris]